MPRSAWSGSHRAPAPVDAATTRWMRAVPLSDLPDEGAIHLELSGIPICLARSEGTVHALLGVVYSSPVTPFTSAPIAGVTVPWLEGVVERPVGDLFGEGVPDSVCGTEVQT